MSRLDLDPLLTFPDGSHWVISTRHSTGEDFSGALYSAVIENDDRIGRLACYCSLELYGGARACLRVMPSDAIQARE